MEALMSDETKNETATEDAKTARRAAAFAIRDRQRKHTGGVPTRDAESDD